jgi:hypothetical protein
MLKKSYEATIKTNALYSVHRPRPGSQGKKGGRFSSFLDKMCEKDNAKIISLSSKILMISMYWYLYK